MDTKSYLQITNCKDETRDINITITGEQFMTDWKKNYYKQISFDLIKYLDNEDVINVDRMYLKFIKFIDIIPMCVLKEPTVSSFFDRVNVIEYDVVTTLDILSRIMITPFKINDQQNKWTIWVKLVNNKIHLCTAEDDNQFPEAIAKHFKLMQNYLFVRKPKLFHRQLVPQLHYHFYQVYKLTIGGIQLIYPVEISGVKCEHAVSNNNELTAADHVYCDIFKDGEFSPEIINYNPVWWSKATLMKAKQCFVGVYKEERNHPGEEENHPNEEQNHHDDEENYSDEEQNHPNEEQNHPNEEQNHPNEEQNHPNEEQNHPNEEQNRINQIIHFTIDKYDDKANYENLWSPEAAWNFLQATLIFIKESINSVKSELRNDCVWKVESFVNNDEFVSCQPLIRSIVGANITFKPLPITALTL